MSGRKPNTARMESMLRWYEVACMDGSRPLDKCHAREMLKEHENAPPLPSVPIERQMRIMPIAMKHLPRFTVIDRDRLVLEEATYADWFTAIANELPEGEDLMSSDEAALRILVEQIQCYIQPTKGTTGRRDTRTMRHEAAADMFNKQLKFDQEKANQRLNEKPIKASAIRSAISRYGRHSAQ